MTGDKGLCRYCEKTVPAGASTCPYCGKANSFSQRCPRCRSPIRQEWMICVQCGQSLAIDCPYCHRRTFFGDYCQHCQIRLTVTCSNPKCRAEQPPLDKECARCGKSLR